MLFGLTTAYWLTVHGFVTIVAVLLYAVTSHLLQQRRHPTAAIAWVLFIVLAPYLALPAFLTFGSRKQARPRNRPLLAPPATDGDGPWAIQTALALGQPEPARYDELQIHADGRAALEALWRTIDDAQHTIDLCTFIVGRDAVGHALIERLCAKARAGIKVRVMLDGLGTLMRARPSLRPLRAAGVELLMFVPPLHSPLKGRTNLRDHRKMLIADAAQPTRRLWCGGRNLAGEYFEGLPGHAPWHDLSFDLGGPFVGQASALFAHDWKFAGGAPQASDGADAAELARAAEPGDACAQLIASGPDQADDTVYSLLVTAAYRARRRILLITPYFVPDSALLAALCLAARRGVQVDLLLPARSNHRLSDVARRRALRTLDAAGGRLWTVPHMQHAKLAVIDDTLALAGSTNLDSRSLFLNYELMAAFHDRDAIARFAQWFETERARAVRFEPKRAGLVADVGEGLVLWLGFQL
ncbi:MAG TPA: phospholipase D-like domain-containing protein [Burkholderiaceae bacterium]|nr:phospholipase D-like domain-containing protein [Burkholderiaceae bacterium]